jgi:4-hydroxybenzoate polyprenyltransferase
MGNSRRSPWLHLLRPHHWLKNGLLAVPLLTAQAWVHTDALAALAGAFVAMSLIASATYVLNDLADLAHDRAHAQKRHRPLAAGAIGERPALALAVGLLLAGGLCALGVGVRYAGVVLVYALLTTLYTRALKRVALLDVVALSALWVLRLVGGAVAIGVSLSMWLLSFGAFLFMSLSIAKRCAELEAVSPDTTGVLPGRGYVARDLAAMRTLGISTGMVSILVLALFVDSAPAQAHYAHPMRLWLLCPPLWFWLARLWLVTSRGEMHHDPIVFSLKDRASWLSLLTVSLVWGAALAPW